MSITFYIVHFVLYTLHYTLYAPYDVRWILYPMHNSLHYTLYIIYSILYTIHYMIYTMQFTTYSIYLVYVRIVLYNKFYIITQQEAYIWSNLAATNGLEQILRMLYIIFHILYATPFILYFVLNLCTFYSTL